MMGKSRVCCFTFDSRGRNSKHTSTWEFLSLGACVKYEVIPSIQDQGQGLGLQGQGHMAEICSLQVRLGYYAPPLIGGGIKRCFWLTSDVYLTSV